MFITLFIKNGKMGIPRILKSNSIFFILNNFFLGRKLKMLPPGGECGKVGEPS